MRSPSRPLAKSSFSSALGAALLLCGLGSGCREPPPQRAFAGRLTEANFASERVDGPAAQGLPGDLFLRNDQVRFVIQAPGRAIGPAPYGGNPLDVDFVTSPVGDQLGELALHFDIGRTADFASVEVERDGTDGGDAVIVARGKDANNDFINIRGTSAFTVAFIPAEMSPTIPIGVDVTARYVLSPGAAALRIDYTFDNTTASEQRFAVGTSTDSGDAIEVFHPGIGYGELGASNFVGDSVPTVEYVVLQGRGVAYGIVPDEADPNARAAPLPVGGVVVELYNQRSFAEALQPASRGVVLPPGGRASKTVFLEIARGGAGAIEGRVRARRGQATGAVIGTVENFGKAGARVAIWKRGQTLTAEGLVTTFVADASGAWSGALPPGEYTAIAEGDGWLRSPSVELTVSAATPAMVNLVLPERARIAYRITDGDGNLIPGKISIVGAVANAPSRLFRDTVKDPLPYGLVAWRASPTGDALAPNGIDAPIPVGPGRYRVVVSRGPEWSRYETIVDLGAPDYVEIAAELVRVVDTAGYVAADFHQHAAPSPDSPIPVEERVAANLAEGNELLSSSEHDRLFDYAPIVARLGAADLIDTGIGVETTPFDYGHFNAYPLVVDPLSPSGGAVDWGNRGAGLSPGQIFAAQFAQGAEVVQVNHPRAAPGGIPFQQNFDRAALRFDYATRTFGSDVMALELPPELLGLPEDAALFSPTFNAVELMLGFHPGVDASVVDREWIDTTTMTVLRDWMTFLSFGFVVTAVGDSDTHQRWSVPSALPRTMVRVPDDSPAAVASGIADDVYATVAGTSSTPRDVVVTSGPMLRMWVGDDAATGGIGRTVATATPTLHVRAAAAEWVGLDTIEVYANGAFTIPVPGGTLPDPVRPIYCFSSRAIAPARCAQAIGGVRPLAITVIELKTGHRRVEAAIDLPLDVEPIVGKNRSGATGRDFYLLGRAASRRSLFPVVPTDLDPDDVTIAALIDGAVPDGLGNLPQAITNPIFVDADGGGYRAIFAP